MRLHWRAGKQFVFDENSNYAFTFLTQSGEQSIDWHKDKRNGEKTQIYNHRTINQSDMSFETISESRWV